MSAYNLRKKRKAYDSQESVLANEAGEDIGSAVNEADEDTDSALDEADEDTGS
ncbi:hypothetical protein LPJ53_006542, partial [Coemansia erecta]